MRKITAGLFMSLDGVAQSPKDWRLPFDEEIGKMLGEGVGHCDAILLGRRTYLEFAEYWPTADPAIPMTGFLNDTPKYVLSTTLAEPLAWANSTLIKGDAAKELAKLKAAPGKNIQVPGSPRLVEWLVRQGLMDELTLMIQPVVVGSGRRLFEDTTTLTRLDLVEASGLKSGVVVATYGPAKG